MIAIILSLAVLALWIGGTAQANSPARPAADCSAGNVPGDVLTHTTLSGDLYATDDVKIHPDVALTLTAGTQLTLCGEYEIRVEGGSLHALGSVTEPVVIQANDPLTRWSRIHFVGSGLPVLTTTLRHLVLENGGGNDPTSNIGAVHIYAPNGTVGHGPVLDYVTIRNSGAYGINVRVDENDTTPPLLSNLTITGSAQAPIHFYASAVGGLGGGNELSGNVQDVIEVHAGTVGGGVIEHSQTWQRQPIPYRLIRDFGGLTINGPLTPVLTIEPGTEFLLDPDFGVKIAQGRLRAAGTVTAPISFRPFTPTQKWGQIYFEGSGVVVPTSTLRHVLLQGGGGDDPQLEVGTLDLYAPNGTEGSGPLFEHVIIQDSGAYGVRVRVHEDDATPLVMNHLTVTGSARSPLLLYVSAMNGLGVGNTLSGNAEDVIEVRAGTVLGGWINHNQTWWRQPAPYKLVPDFGDLKIDGPDDPILTLSPGATLWLSTGMGINVQQGGLVAVGTPQAPITLTSVGNTSVLSWAKLRFDGHSLPQSRLAYVNVLHSAGDPGAIDFRGTKLTLDHVTIRHSQNAGVYGHSGFIRITHSQIESNGEAVRLANSTGGLLRRNLIRDNDAGMVVVDNDDGICVDAMANYWGSADGPADDSAALDACNRAAAHAGGGDSVGDDVLYSPWLPDADGDGLSDASSITPGDYWVIADGVQTTTLTITLRDEAGTPLPGKQIELESTRGVVQQPQAPTDENGVTTAVISSTETGDAIVTARNTSDDQALASIAALNFWGGSGDAGGLVGEGGVPYASPQLHIKGRPFQEGFPMVFVLPMQNTNPNAMDVRVVYGISGLSIGSGFTPVYTAEKQLAPGESWDAQGGWVPDVTGHHCVRATLYYSSASALQWAGIHAPLEGSISLQKNEDIGSSGGGDDGSYGGGDNGGNGGNGDKPPCQDPPDDNSFAPESPGFNTRDDLEKVAKHQKQQGVNMGYGVCQIDNLGDPPTHGYREIATVPQYDFPDIEPDQDVTPAQAESLNALSDLSARLTGLYQAMEISLDRMAGASAAGEWVHAARQLAAFRQFVQQAAQVLYDYADEMNVLLSVTEGAGVPDVSLTPQDYLDELARLQSQGFSSDTLAFYQDAGFGDETIQAILENSIGYLDGAQFQTISFYDVLRNQRDRSREAADRLLDRYGVQNVGAAQAGGPHSIPVSPMFSHFRVGNPTDSPATVRLKVRPASLPLDWSYELSDPTPTLTATETTSVTLILYPPDSMVEETEVKLGVEGYVDGQYVGGVMVVRRAPRYMAAPGGFVYIPLVIKGK